MRIRRVPLSALQHPTPYIPTPLHTAPHRTAPMPVQVSEKLPDIAVLMTPHRFLVDIYMEFSEDMVAAGIPAMEHCTRQWFCHLWNFHPQLSHITIASGKENFGRCTNCQEAEERLGKARKGSDAQELLHAKQDRLDHLLEERADKLSYYAVRVTARQPAADVISAIIDKMDGSKNLCPR